MLNVCCALIIFQGQLLAVQRGEGHRHALQWEFPGGKMEVNETPKECIVREIHEELQVKINPGKQLESVNHQYPDKEIQLIPFICEINEAHIYLTEHVQKRWLSPNEITELDWQEADYSLILLNLTEILSCMWENHKKG